MNNKSKKREQLNKLKPKTYRIYGIFNFKTNNLVYVSMTQELAETEFDFSDFDPNDFDIVSFNVSLT